MQELLDLLEEAWNLLDILGPTGQDLYDKPRQDLMDRIEAVLNK